MASPLSLGVAKLFLVGWLVIGGQAFADSVGGDRTILVVGDSISAAYRIDTELGWVSLLQQKITADRRDWRVVNASVSGDTTLDGLTKIDGILADVKPRVVILELGANDGLRGYPIDSIRENLVELVDKAQAQGAFVVLAGMQLPQNYGPKYIEEFRLLFYEISESKATGLIPFLMDGVATDGALMQDDGLHPNELGQPGLMRNAWATLAGHLEEIEARDD